MESAESVGGTLLLITAYIQLDNFVPLQMAGIEGSDELNDR